MRLVLLSGYLLAPAMPWLHRVLGDRMGWLVALLPLGFVAYFLSFLGPVAEGETLHLSYAWVPSLGISLSFYLDGLSLVFALMISGIGTLVAVYGGGYLAGHRQLGAFYAYLLMFMASMLGVVLAGNLVTLFVFWELTTISSYLLIGFDHERAAARSAALQGLLVTGMGGLALLAGVLLLGQVAGSFEFPVLLDEGRAVREDALYLPILLLILVGAFTKSAQFPFHFWLPNAMEAPTPVSAYLHSATMVKAGVYLLARLQPVLGGTETWQYALVLAGGITMLLGAFLAVLQGDLKRVLAYSTLSVLGTLTLLVGLGTTAAIKAAVVVLLAHALYKGALFLVVGVIDHETGVREVDRLGGLRRAMPITAVAAGLAALSMAGILPWFGFIAKELFYEAVMGFPAEQHLMPEVLNGRGEEGPLAAPFVTVAAVLASMLLVAAAVLVGLRPFFGERPATPKTPHEGPLSLWLGPLLLSLGGLFFGLAPMLLARPLLQEAAEAVPPLDVLLQAMSRVEPLMSQAASAVAGEEITIKLVLWHGWNVVFGLSLLTLAGGLGVYAARTTLLGAGLSVSELLGRGGPSRWYEWMLISLNFVATRQTRLLQSGYLRFYLLMIVGTTVGLVGFALMRLAPPMAGAKWTDIHFYEAVLALLILLATLVAVRSKSRFRAVAALGVVGYSVALIFVLYGAPDLAMTQFVIETLLVILFVLIFYHLPRFANLSSPAVRMRDLLVALTFGGVMIALLLVSIEARSPDLLADAPPTISEYFARESYPAAHGRNIVNVILVDFRAMDTLGEITVLAVAGIGVFALLKLHMRKGRRE